MSAQDWIALAFVLFNVIVTLKANLTGAKLTKASIEKALFNNRQLLASLLQDIVQDLAKEKGSAPTAPPAAPPAVPTKVVTGSMETALTAQKELKEYVSPQGPVNG